MRSWRPVAVLVVLGMAAAGVAVAAPTGGYVDAVSHPKVDPYYPDKGSPTVDALHYDLALSWRDADDTLEGSASIFFRVPRDESSVHLDLASFLHVAGVTLDGAAVAARHPGNDLLVDTGALDADTRHTLVVTYHGSPRQVRAPVTRSDIPGVGWKTTRAHHVWSMQEPWGAYTWYPVNDHPSDKAYYDLAVDVRRDWRAVANGELVSNVVNGDRRTMRWSLSSPAASYLVTIAIGRYRRSVDTGPHGLPLTYWLRPGDTSLSRRLHRSPAMLQWLEGRLGRYPFDRAGAVVVPSRSAMETQTLVTMGADALDGPEGASALLHEYAHQWYGDTVTPDNWRDLWMNEGFAMYLEIRWDATHGVRSMRSWRRTLTAYDQYLRDEYGPPGDYHRDSWGSANVYYCAALMLDRLRAKIGDRDFRRVLRTWPQRHRSGSVDRGDWIAWLNDATGRDLTRWVHRWLNAKRSPA